MSRPQHPARRLAAALAVAALALAGCGDDGSSTADLDDSRTDACRDLEAVVGLPIDADPSGGYSGLVEAVPDDAPADVRQALDRLRDEVGAAVAAPLEDDDVSAAVDTLARYLDCPDLIGDG
jgi:hypothetical protein